MLSRGNRKERRWGVVLATGESQRVRRLALRVFGRGRPGQYCPATGGATPIEHTVRQAACLVAPERILTVIGNGHSVYLNPEVKLPGRILEEPANRGTGACIMLPLVYVLAEDPEGTVLILPSDHYLISDEQFVLNLERAAHLAECLSNRLVVLGVAPTRPQADFGWVEAGPFLEGMAGFGARSVKKFYEKPSHEEAEGFLQRGYFWNTRVMAVKARVLWTIGQQLFPTIIKRFENLLDLLKLIKSGNASPDLEELALRDVYRGLETSNFSRRVLQAPEWITLLPMADLTSAGWGHDGRVAGSDLRSSNLRLA
ncbi:MAG: sugar phosphate nucleotidyltransferase [Acidobacteriota bacterium]